MSALKHPLHLIVIVVGMVGVALSVWRADLAGGAFPGIIFGGVAFSSAIDLARRLGLEPLNDPANPSNRKAQ